MTSPRSRSRSLFSSSAKSSMPLERPPENLTTWGSELCRFDLYRKRYSFVGSCLGGRLRRPCETVSFGTSRTANWGIRMGSKVWLPAGRGEAPDCWGLYAAGASMGWCPLDVGRPGALDCTLPWQLSDLIELLWRGFWRRVPRSRKGV